MEQTQLNTADLKEVLFDIAQDCLKEGPGFAQETVVLREAGERLGLSEDVEQQQRLLTAWHDLFRDGKLSWGYDVDNPSAPFYHLAKR